MVRQRDITPIVKPIGEGILKILNPKPAPEGLIPIGDDGLYVTPDEVSDPLDCRKYPTSPFCGGNPLSPSPIGLGWELIKDKCNIGIRFDPVLGFIKLPPGHIVYRHPECRNPKPPQPPAPPNGNNYPVKVPKDASDRCGILLAYWSGYKGNVQFPPTPGELPENLRSPFFGGTGGSFEETLVGYIRDGIAVTSDGTASFVPHDDGEPPYEAYGDVTTRIVYVASELSSSGTINLAFYDDQPFGIVRNTCSSDNIDTPQFPPPLPPDINPPGAPPPMGCCPSTNTNDALLKAVLKKLNRLCDVVGIDNYSTPPDPNLTSIVANTYAAIGVDDYDVPFTTNLTRKVDKLADTLGVEEFPALLPDSLISKDEGFLGNLIPNEPVEINNFAKLFEWYIKRFDEIVGQFEIAIEIKDSDPTVPGEQPVGMKLPNIAEAIGEIFTLNFQTYINSETTLNAVMRILAEVGADKQQNFVSYKLLQSLTDWAGFKQKDIKLLMPLLFTLNKTRYDEILKESTVAVQCVEFDDKFGLEADFMAFREAASILKANYKVKLDPNGNIRAQILKYLLDTYATTKKINTEDDDDFDQFLQDVELGFTTTPGAINTTDPYGRPFADRPKIRDLTNPDDIN